MSWSRQKNRPAVLLLGNYRPTPRLAQMLRSLGYAVLAEDRDCESACEKSRFIDELVRFANGADRPSALLTELRDFASQRDNLAAIFPVSEKYVRLFAEHEAETIDLPPLIMNEARLVRTCLDKPAMLDICLQTEVPAAPFAMVTNIAELESATETVGFPLVVRPLDSTKRLGDEKALIVGSRETLDANPEIRRALGDGLLLQAVFEGVRHNIYFAAYRGRLVRHGQAVIDRTDKRDGTGLAVEGRTVEPCFGLLEQTARLVDALGYSGIGCAQFLVDAGSGQTCFLEINPRIAGNHALADAAGLDLGRLLVETTLDGTPDLAPRTGHAGLRFAWLSADLLALKIALKRGELDGRQALQWAGSIAGSWWRADTHIVFKPDDPMPALGSLWRLLPRINRFAAPSTDTPLLGNRAGTKGESP